MRRKRESDSDRPAKKLHSDSAPLTPPAPPLSLPLPDEEDMSTLDLLLSLGANPKSADDLGRSPLSLAAAEDNATAIYSLVKRGADVSCKDNSGSTPLDIALSRSAKNAVTALIKCGARWESIALHATDSDYGNFESVVRLHECGVDLDLNTVEGLTLLHLACSNGQVEMARWLLDKGICGLECRTKMLEESPLHLAAEGGHVDVTRLLLEKGAGLNPRDGRGWTPLRWAMLGNHKELVSYLTSVGATL